MKNNTTLKRRFDEKMDDDMQKALFIFFKGMIKSCVYEAIDDYVRDNKTNIAENKNDTEEWLSTEDAKKMLGIKSKSKMQQLRDNGEIVFSQHGRTIKYSGKSILLFLQKNVVNVHEPPLLKRAA